MSESWPVVEVLSGGASDVPPEVQRRLYEDMILLRTFDERAINLQRQGRIGTFPPSLGQEASEIGSAHALRRSDWVVPSYRDHGALMVHGLPLSNVVLFAMGRTPSLSSALKALPTSIPIATHLPHAVGLAVAAQKLGTDDLAMAYFGDGGTSEGDFHEALNFAGVYKAPVIFFCQNNGWAISVPRARQTASETLAQKAVAYGIAGRRVDGNDVLAVYQVVGEAAARARRGEGPTLIESLTYRLGPHTTADDPSRYRPADEYQDWKESRDPIQRMGGYLMAHGLLTAEDNQAIRQAAQDRIQAEVEAAEALAPVEPGGMFQYVFRQPPGDFATQQRRIEEAVSRG
ncbi:MAG: pyruvate dehydrogenase (acetyl-transferring) E1 component subunit alpha [Thermaerobacter sp.]|nr:pyruvate dehydrogenase (acetyl-transferring) E1 component subunit alpha [Thermaerobacter sp.]